MIPQAPTPPPWWKQVLNPQLAAKYSAELQAYRIATGQVTEADAKQQAAIRWAGTAVVIVVLVAMAWAIIAGIQRSHNDPDLQRLRKMADESSR